jgi:ribosomal protein S18 acetylase RimI-like enzyme
MNKKYRWVSVKQNNFEGIENFLRKHESFCTALAAKLKKGLQKSDKLWKLYDESNAIKALLLYSNRALYPIFNNIDSVPVPRFIRFPFMQYPVYAIQGCQNDVLQIEKMLASRGQIPSDPKDFFLMELNDFPSVSSKNNTKLIIRKPMVNDFQNLYELHRQYEIEEVIPKNGTFNPLGCKYAVQSMMLKDQVFVGEIDERLVAKANINAESFTRCQIGGVFVDPAFRCNGYASEVVSLLCGKIISADRGVTLFVNKINAPAIKVYQKIGFKIISDYRITYY